MEVKAETVQQSVVICTLCFTELFFFKEIKRVPNFGDSFLLN